MSNDDAPERRSIIKTLADQYNMEASKFQQMVMATCFPASPPATPEEFAAGMQIAHRLDLNPLTKEVHFARIKGGGIQAITGVDGWFTMANRHPEYDGCEFDYEWINGDGPKKLISVTCRIFRKDRTRPTAVTEYMAECFRPNSEAWKLTPSRMLRHRAFGQCARLAFAFAGIMDHDEFERWQEEAAPPVKRMSSAAAKRDGTSIDKFKALLPKLETAHSAEMCKAIWLDNTELLKTAARSWFEMLSQACMYRMKDFGVVVDADDYGWPIFDNETLEAIKNAAAPPKEATAEAEAGPDMVQISAAVPNLSPSPVDAVAAAAPFDEDATEAALNGFRAELAGAHTLNKIGRIWTKWQTPYNQCGTVAQSHFLIAKAAAMKRVKDAIGDALNNFEEHLNRDVQRINTPTGQ